MIPIACSIRSATSAKIEKAVGMGSSAIFDEEYTQDTILEE